jgi:NADPH:quinone reductase-like Zn-dependent oxidoreductase
MTTSTIPTRGAQLRSLITADGTLELSLVDVEIPELAPDDVLVRVEAAPVNPSDLIGWCAPSPLACFPDHTDRRDIPRIPGRRYRAG